MVATPVTPATWEAESRGIIANLRPARQTSKTLSQKQKQTTTTTQKKKKTNKKEENQ